MKNDFFKLYFRLMKYAAFMGIIGGIASFVGPPHHGLIKAYIGVTIGAMLLGRRLPDALKDFFRANDEFIDDAFRE